MIKQIAIALFLMLCFFSSCDSSQDEKTIFSLEEDYIEIMQTNDRNIKIYNYNKDVQLTNNNPNIADASINNEGVIHIHGITPGETNLIVTDKSSNSSCMIIVKVISQFATIRLNFTDYIDPLFKYDWPVEIYLVNNVQHDFHMVYFVRPSYSHHGELLYSGTYQFVNENGKLRYLILAEKNGSFKREYDLWQLSCMAEQNDVLDNMEMFYGNKLEEPCYQMLTMYEENLKKTFNCSFYFKYYGDFPTNIIE